MLNPTVLKGLLAASALAMLCTAPGVQAQTSSIQAPAGQGQGMAATGAAAPATLSKGDQRIMGDLALSNMAEIEAARMAQNKSQTADIRNFAQQMLDDHGRSLSELQSLAQSRGVTLPTAPDRQHQAQAARLNALSGEQFDKAYLAQSGVAAHKKTHRMLTQARSRAKDPALQALVAKLEPTVQQHLSTAQQLHGGKTTARGSSGTGAQKSGQ